MNWKLLPTFGILVAAVSVFVLSRFAGRMLQSEGETAHVEPVAATSSDVQSLDTLPDDAKNRGLRLVDGRGTNKMFVHPESRSWLEVPTTSPLSDRDDPLVTSEDMGFVGAVACVECHKENHEDFIRTAHHLTSTLPSAENIHGAFESGRNRLSTNQPDLSFEMTQENGSFFQHVDFRGLRKSFQIDLVTGAGHVGQTFLYWVNDALYQMHVSYFKEPDAWVNSPGYHDGTAWYTREVIPKCVDCHMTYMQWIPDTTNRYRKETAILGVSCERCHGPGKDHVMFHKENPSETSASFIVNPADLSAEQTNDVCAQCHFGSGERRKAPFTFRPGDRLEDFWDVDASAAAVKGAVHSSNQLARMKLSRCYTESEGMTCMDCHDPHKQERGQLQLFSTRCLNCHEIEHCGKANEIGPSISTNCIDCHMPKSPDTHLPFESTNSVQFPMLRDHHVRIDEEAAVRFIEDVAE